MSDNQSASAYSSKRTSPAPASQPVPKRVKVSNESSSPSIINSSHGPIIPGTGNAPSSSSLDPEMLSDALLSAGVDIKEEESLLSRSLYGSGTSSGSKYSTSITSGVGSGGTSFNDGGINGHILKESYGVSAPVLPPLLERIYEYQQRRNQTPFLDPGRLQYIFNSHAHDMGLSLSKDIREVDAMLTLISYSCQEWLSDIITSSLVISRHRRRSRNNVHSEVSRALRNIAQKEKEDEEKRLVRKAQKIGENDENGEGKGASGNGSGSGLSKKERNNADDSNTNEEGTKARGRGRGTQSDEINYSAANATVQMMTSGSKRKYSWLTEGTNTGGVGNATNAAGSALNIRGSGAGLRSDGTVRYREVREEQGLVVRDLILALEHQRAGVLNAILKGYSKKS
ncbi:uncharacterized protein SAPINGB_P003855 [Magnusiomyces paraingens]|uniref:Transcription initiation factor TFIID subunit 4 n=1 Tax=Magnusiomyces paraingens TaxID=2606893 RepID=A0A5E8BWX1_9ASCO|nr:uncharacterized protein SAPINGB_P003855 [Saprochaete ingens]VVT53997.1 unnamed protein product [Saprochaete ingens]